ncbi:MAG: hypothetical protein WBW61_00770 [Rhodanobacteraceae bacterium]
MLHWTHRPRPLHPLARLLVGVLGAIVLVVVIAFGMFAAVAFLVGGAVLLLVNALRAPHTTRQPGATPPTPPGVIEGEFRVIPDAREKHT